MDRQLTPPSFFRKHFKLLLVLCGILTGAGILLLLGMGDRSQKVDAAQLQIAAVTEGPFSEQILLEGIVQPERVMLIDAVESGRVEEKLVREGEMVQQGQALLRMSNPELKLQLIQREEQLSLEEDQLASAAYMQEKERLQLEEQLNEIQLLSKTAMRAWIQDSTLYEKGGVSQHDYLKSRDELIHLRERKRILQSKLTNEQAGAALRLQQYRNHVAMKKQNLQLAREANEALTVKAPASGQLSSFAVEAGAYRNKGERLGQIDVIDGFKIRAQIDEHFISRVYTGQEAYFELEGKRYPLRISVIYPEIRNGQFEADLHFVNTKPVSLKRGQSIQLRIELSEQQTAQRIPRGAFYQTSGGNWVYVVKDEGKLAEKRNIRLGRQNDAYFEVLSGLKTNEKVIVSSYSNFGDYPLLKLDN